MTISIQVPCDGVFVVIYFKTMYDKTIISFGFCDILINQGLGKCYQRRPSAQLMTLTETLIIPDIRKTSSNNYLELTFCIFRRDLHPKNVLLDEEGHVLLTYFGSWEETEHVPDEGAVNHFYCAPGW